MGEQLERFGKRNDYSAAYLAGIFDGCGGVEKGAPYFARMSSEERMLVERLGFMTKKWRGRTYVSKRDDFFSFVKPWLRHPVTKQ